MWQAYSSADQILGPGRVRMVSASAGSPRSLETRIPKRLPEGSQRAGHGSGAERVVVELALFAAIHAYIVADPRATRGRGGAPRR